MFSSADIRRLTRRVRSIRNELDYAQRRSFELRTGLPAGGRALHRRSVSIQELEQLYRR